MRRKSKIENGKKISPQQIDVILQENGKERQFKVVKGTILEEFFYEYRPGIPENPVVAAKVDYSLEDLWYPLNGDCRVEPVDLSELTGVRIYETSLVLLLITTVEDLYPEYALEVSHSISGGLYCELKGKIPLRRDMVEKLEEHMRQLIQNDERFQRVEISRSKAIKLFRQKNVPEKVELLKSHADKQIVTYECGESRSNFCGPIVPRASYLKYFELIFYPPGIILRYLRAGKPDESGPLPPFQEQSRLFQVFQEHKKWAAILDVRNIAELNNMISSGKVADLTKVAEAIHHKKFGHIADQISQNRESIRLILIAGPSSSGKTTFAKRLAIYLKINDVNTVPISLDNYFKPHSEMPRDEKGEYDFEGVDAIDIKLLNDHLNRLFDGLEVMVPEYDFRTGERRVETRPLRIKRSDALILEGIHALNDKLTPFVHRLQKFKIYVSALTVLNIDRHNRIPTTDLRIIRRVVRDYAYRSYTALETLRRWPAIRRGENAHIFPFQDQADVMFNSALIYELAVLKPFAEPLLKKIPIDILEYSEAMRLLTFLSYFEELKPDHVPPTSILREFIGGSSFKY